jgi:lipid II:glycine glycyltransferase (peptidoglycan interpeptide bridge formation enzyme)
MSIIAFDSCYTIEMDQVTKAEWEEFLQRFDDANIYQTWSYGAVRWGEKNLSHLVLKKEDEVVAMAQLRIVKLPGIDAGIAYLFRGPLWKLRGREKDVEILSQMVRALRRTYATECRLWLRILPNEIDNGNHILPALYKGEGFKWEEGMIVNRTLLIDLSLSLDELRKGTRRKWRQALGYAEKRELELIEGTSDELYDIALMIYQEMHARKKFVEFVDMNQYRTIQRDLPDPLKVIISICTLKSRPIAALAWSAMGNTGLPVLAATGDEALKTNASNLMWWKMIEWFKQRSYRWCDVGAIDPVSNPGGYRFKSGLAGKYGRDIKYYGQFDACENWVSSLSIGGGDKLRFVQRKGRVIFSRLKNKLQHSFTRKSENDENSKS